MESLEADHWARWKAELGLSEGIRIAAELRGHVPAIKPHWPSEAEREEDLRRLSSNQVNFRFNHLLLDMPYALPYADTMKTVTATEARRTLYRLLDEVAVASEPVQITGRRANAVLVSEADWRSIEETLFLLSVPGMRESLSRGMETPLEECVEELDW